MRSLPIRAEPLRQVAPPEAARPFDKRKTLTPRIHEAKERSLCHGCEELDALEAFGCRQ